MVDHLRSRVTPWRQYTSHVKGSRHFIENGCISKLPQKILCRWQKAPKNTFWKAKNPKNTLQNHYTFNSKSQARYDNNEEQWLLKYLVNKIGPRKYC